MYQYQSLTSRPQQVLVGLAAIRAIRTLAALTLFSSAASAPTFGASYRKDAWLPQYLEVGVPEPLVGGRLHIVGVAAASGAIGDVVLNGTVLDMRQGLDPSTWAADWVRVEPAGGLVAGQPFWVSLHSRRAAWDAALAAGASATLEVLDNASSAVLAGGSFAVQTPAVRAMWATTARGRADVHVFLRNEGAEPATLARALMNNVDVTAAVPAAAAAVPAGESVVWVLPASLLGGAAAVAEGAAWTLEVRWSEPALADTAAGGNFWREFFPIETWEHGSDCPCPGINDTA